MSITVFKAGRMIGPLDKERAAALVKSGELSENDLAQDGGVEVWVPLRRLLPRRAAPTRFNRALRRTRASCLGFWAAMHFEPFRIGLACLLSGCLLIVLGRWTFFLFVPAFAASVFAGAILLTRRRFVMGTTLSAGALILPALFLLATSEDAKNIRGITALPLPSIPSVIPPQAPLVVPAKPQPTSFAGLALPRRVRPTPAPRQVPPI